MIHLRCLGSRAQLWWGNLTMILYVLVVEKKKHNLIWFVCYSEMKINMSSWSSTFPTRKKIYKLIILKSATLNKNSARLRCGEEISAWATICKQLFLDTTSKYSKYISLIQEKGGCSYSVYFTQLPVGIYSHSKKCEHVRHSVNVWWKQDDQHLSSNSVRDSCQATA